MTDGRPSEFSMPIQGGMLEALGINMYTTLGKCLVEFIANAYDGEATYVDIDIPINEIKTARANIRKLAKVEVAEGKRDKFEVLLEALPEDINVTITDDGHGMSWKDIQEKYLPLNRKRRADGAGKESVTKSETGKRFVMGRKGLGKLAGFGAAENVSVTSKRKDETFSTTAIMRDELIKNSKNMADLAIPATYQDELDTEEHFTIVKLSGLKSDAVREQIETLKSTIAEAFFGLRPEEFSIFINGDIITPSDPNYVVMFPPERGIDGFADHTFTVEDIGDISIRYFVGFREKSLAASKRGARIYCNNRLAAGPALFNLPTGMHSFHSTDYLECIVEADSLDRENIDFVNTNRSQLREDTDVVRTLLSEVSSLMKKAVATHAKYRVDKAEADLKSDKTGKVLTSIVAELPRKSRKNVQQLLTIIAAQFQVDSDEFRELAPVILNSINATEVLIELVNLKTNPETISKVAQQLRELGEIERSDALKLFRARRNGIIALQKLRGQGEELWKKVGIENELHQLMKDNPWLIRPEFSNYLTSDQGLNTVVSSIAKELKIDSFAVIKDDVKKDSTRPDLVFIMSDPTYEGPFVLNIVELKSPTLPLNIEHFRQLQDYIFKVKDWVGNNLQHTVSLRGFLIGTMPLLNASAPSQKQLLGEFSTQGTQSEIRIVGLTELMKDAQSVHMEAIKVLEDAEQNED